ncbi:glycosyltransferase family 2 protein [Flavobacteriaceae bacterium]|nr:glycosyltransferase family 2 protein [Flavobacteriaceae bacterium]
MRLGKNPQKNKSNLIDYGELRIIMPFYFNSKDSYFDQSLQVLKKCLDSIIESSQDIDLRFTLIINSAEHSVLSFVDGYNLDKIVLNRKNEGKLFSCINEARNCKEQFVGIIDSDVIFRKGWFDEALTIFNISRNIGVVSLCPQPNLAFYHNNSLFGSFLLLKLKIGNFVTKEYLELFERGVGNRNIYSGNINWKRRQMMISDGTAKCIIGGGHFASIYRTEVFKKLEPKKINFVFKNGDENNHLDGPIDKAGYFRLSTLEPFVYHMGNVYEDYIEGFNNLNYKGVKIDQKQPKRTMLTNYVFGYFISNILKRILKSW